MDGSQFKKPHWYNLVSYDENNQMAYKIDQWSYYLCTTILFMSRKLFLSYIYLKHMHIHRFMNNKMQPVYIYIYI